MHKYVKYLVGGMFFILPLFFLLPPFANTLEAQLTGAKLILCFVLGNAFFSYYLGFIHPVFSLIHIVFTLSTVLTGFGAMQLYPFAYWSAGVSLALVFVTLDRETQSFWLRCVVYGAAASSVLAIFQALDLDPILSYAPNITPEERRLPVGMLGQATKHGAFLAIAFGLALGLKERVALAVILLAALLTKSSFTYLSLLGAFLIWLRYAPRGKLLVETVVLAGTALVVALLPFVYNSKFLMDNGRFTVWESALTAWWDGPRILGFGLGSFGYVYAPNFQPKSLIYGDFLQAHNDYVQVLFELGYLGAILLSVLSVLVIRHYVRNWWEYLPGLRPKSEVLIAAECGLAAILLNAIGNFPFQLAPHYLLGILFLALLLDTSDNTV